MAMTDTTGLLALHEAAQELGVTNHELADLIAAGELHPVAVEVEGRLGRVVHVPQDQIDAYRAAHRSPT